MMTYASPTWAVIPKSSMNRLQAVENRALSLIGSYDMYSRMDKIHSELEIIMLKSFMKYLDLKLYASAKFSTNKYIKRLGDSLFINRRVPKPPKHPCLNQRRAIVRPRYPIQGL